VWSHNSGGPSVYVWLILLSVFIADATYTLILRILRGEPWYSAHRTHAYQKLVQMGYTHRRVTMGVLLINVCALWPLAYLAHGSANAAIYICLMTYIALALVWWRVQSRSIRMTLY
jgi:Fuc2NAc and GlcNAc transferase